MDSAKHTMVIPNEVMMKEIAFHISEGRSAKILCRGNSMNPFLCDRRDSLVLSPVPSEGVRKGDVVLARVSTGNFVVHRVVDTDPLTLNGDGNFIRSCERVVPGGVLAVLSGYERKGREGSTSSLEWRTYSAFWRIAGKIGVGRWNLRRIILGFWRRSHRSLVHAG